MLKTLWAKLLVALVALFAPVMPLLITVGVFIMMDTIVGTYRSYKLKTRIKSNKMWGGLLTKIFITAGSVFSVYLMDKYLIMSGLHLERIVATLICLTELKSISESIEMLYGYNMWNMLKKILKKSTNSAKDLMDDIK